MMHLSPLRQATAARRCLFRKKGGRAALTINRGGAGSCTTVVRACAAGELGPLGHDHPILGGGLIQPLRTVLADHDHRRLAAGARFVIGFQRHLDPRKTRRQRGISAAALGNPVLSQRRIALLRFGFILGDRLLDRLEAELQLFFRQALGFRAELRAPTFSSRW